MPDAFRLTEWKSLIERDDDCFIAGCDNDDIDYRGPIYLRDGSIHKACREHWEGIIRVLGEQSTWEQDAGRWSA